MIYKTTLFSQYGSEGTLKIWRNFSTVSQVHEQRNYLVTFLNQWEAATENGSTTELNEVHISLDMNIDTNNGR